MNLSRLSWNFKEYVFHINSSIQGDVSLHRIGMHNLKAGKELFIEVEVLGSAFAFSFDGVVTEEFRGVDINDKLIELISEHLK
jgi:hypothetical protein